MTDTTPPFALYNPALLPPEVLLSEFTARQPLLRRLLEIVRSNLPGEPPQHVLVVGPRGMGKTTLLCAISASILRREPELAKQWLPVLFDEESRRIGDLADFWLECIRQWEATTAPALVQSARIEALLDLPDAELEDRAKETFLKLIDDSGRRGLLLIDNFNDVLSAVHDHEALLRLRSFLMADSRVMIIGAATRWFEEVANVDKPFFEFFRNFDLQALNFEEMCECLRGVAEARGDQRVLEALATYPKSIEALHILTGGNPRLIRTFYRLLNEGLHGHLRQQLERLIDDYTPYLKAILDALPRQQQQVLDAIALHWNPCDVATVARQSRLPSNQVSAQIRMLMKAGLVSEVPAMGTLKKKAYMLTDRFSNIHYLMRHGRAGQLRMHWFVMTLRVLFDDERFADAVADSARKTAKNGGDERDALAMAHAALDNAGNEATRRMLFDRLVGSSEFDADVDPAFAEKLCREALAKNPEDPLAHFEWGRLLCVHFNRRDEAEAEYRKAIELDPQFTRPWHNLGVLLAVEFERYEEAEASIRQAIGLDERYKTAWSSLGWLLAIGSDRPNEAEAALRKAIELDPSDTWTWSRLGWLLGNKLGRHEEAATAYRNALELDPRDEWTWSFFADLLTEKFGQNEEAEAAYRKALELDPKDEWTWNNLGDLLTNELARHEEAEVAFRKAIEVNPNHMWSWHDLGDLLTDELDRHDEAEVAYRKAIELDPKEGAPWNNLGVLLADKFGRHEEAEAAFRKAIELDPKNAKAQANLARVLTVRGNAEDAHIAAVRALRLDPADDWVRDVFREQCFLHRESLLVALPEVSLWSSQHAENRDVNEFAHEAWLAYARVASPAAALQLMETQPPEVRLAFEVLHDVFRAHADRNHLHRLAPERRVPVLKLMERLEPRAEPS